MNNQLDKLFKDKLGDHAMSPSADSWLRVQANLSKKNNGLSWFRVAAALLMFGALATTLVWLRYGSVSAPSTQLSNKNQPEVTQPAKPDQLNTKVAVADNRSSEKKKQVIHQLKKEIKTSGVATGKKMEMVQPEPKPDQTPPSEMTIQTPTPQPVMAAAIEQVVEKPIVLEYRLESITPLPQSGQSNAEENIGVKNKSGLRKVLDFALDAKNSDSSLGDLRQAKDGLLAFNFKKDKLKTAK